MTTSTPFATPRTRPRGSGPLVPALAGAGALAAAVAAATSYADPLRGAATPAAAAAVLAEVPVARTALLLAVYALLALVIVGRLAARLGRDTDGAAVRLLPVLGGSHLLLLAAAFTAPAAAVGVGTGVFTTGVTATAVETALLLVNVVFPLASWTGAALTGATALAAWSTGASRILAVVSAAFCVGLASPPVSWIVTYLLPLWFAGVGFWLWRRD
ncbi:hypothetical protein [Geodermatophilus sp. URMC 63]